MGTGMANQFRIYVIRIASGVRIAIVYDVFLNGFNIHFIKFFQIYKMIFWLDLIIKKKREFFDNS